MTEHKCSFCGAKEEKTNVLVGDECGHVFICETCWEKIGMLLERPIVKSKAANETEKRSNPTGTG